MTNPFKLVNLVNSLTDRDPLCNRLTCGWYGYNAHMTEWSRAMCTEHMLCHTAAQHSMPVTGMLRKLSVPPVAR